MDRKTSFDNAVQEITTLLQQTSQLSHDAARGKATRAVSYEVARRRGSVTRLSQISDWQDVQQRLGEGLFKQICDRHGI